MRRLKFLKPAFGGSTNYLPGQEYDVPDMVARRLLAENLAVELTSIPPGLPTKTSVDPQPAARKAVAK